MIYSGLLSRFAYLERGFTPCSQPFMAADLMDDVCRLADRQASQKGLELRVVPTRLQVDGDRLLLALALRALVANALEHTFKGGVLLGYRIRGRGLALEVWDTGAGVSDDDLHRALGDRAVETPDLNGLGPPDLKIVRDVAGALGYEVRVRSSPGRGTVFSIEGLKRAPNRRWSQPVRQTASMKTSATQAIRYRDPTQCVVLVIEADDTLQSRIQGVLQELSYKCSAATSLAAALDLVEARGQALETVIVGRSVCGTDPLACVEQIQRKLGRDVAGVVLASDMHPSRPSSLTAIGAAQGDMTVSRVGAVTQLGSSAPAARPRVGRPSLSSPSAHSGEHKPIAVVTADPAVRTQVSGLLHKATGRVVDDFASYNSLQSVDDTGSYGCILIDMNLPGIESFGLLQSMKTRDAPPVVLMAEQVNVRPLIRALNAGAAGFVELPIDPDLLLQAVEGALARTTVKVAGVPVVSGQLSGLTPRQHQVLELVLAGLPSKIIAADLGISQRTVENHRAAIMKRSGARSLPALTRMAFQSF